MSNKNKAIEVVKQIDSVEELKKLEITDEILGANIGSGETVFHRVLYDGGIEGIKYLVSKITNFENLFKIQNSNGELPIETIENAERFNEIKPAFQEHALEFLIAKSYDKKTYVQLLLEGEEVNSELINAVVEFANKNSALRELLMAKDKFKETPISIALKKDNILFIKNVFSKIKNKDAVLLQTLNSNENLLYAAFASSNEAVILFFAEQITESNKESLIDNAGGDKPITLLFQNTYFIQTLNTLHNKAFILEAVLLNIDELKELDVFNLHFSALYTDIKDNDKLKSLFLGKINLENQEEANNFPDMAITDRLSQEENSLVTNLQHTANNIQEALEKISKYKKVYESKTPKSFGDNLKDAAKYQLSGSLEEQKDFIATARNASDLAAKYTTAENVTNSYTVIYNMLNTADIDQNEDIKLAVKTKAETLVDLYVDCADVSVLKKAQECKKFIKSFASDHILKTVVTDDFAREKLSCVQETIQKNTISTENLTKGIMLAFYMFKDKAVLNVMEEYANASTKSTNITTPIITLIHLKTEIDTNTSEVMGISTDKRATSMKIYNESYHAFYSKGMLYVKPENFINNFGKKDNKLFKEYFAKLYNNDDGDSEAGYIHENINLAKKQICQAFKLNEEGCSEEKILEIIHIKYCDNQKSIANEDVADKLFCTKSSTNGYQFNIESEMATFLELTELNENLNEYIDS